MATQLKQPTDVRSQVSEEEWALRVDLAAAYRLLAHYGMDDTIYTHTSVRLPGPEHHFLINRYGVMFHEMRASDLVKIDPEAFAVIDGKLYLNYNGQVQGTWLKDTAGYIEKADAWWTSQ